MIRDKMLALEEYARQACNCKAEWKAAEIRIRAERKAGQLLKEIERSKGGQPKKNSSPDGDSSRETEYQRVKREANISEKQAERWQQLAALPHGGFEGLCTIRWSSPRPQESKRVKAGALRLVCLGGRSRQ
jgi:hypothetical protein